MTASRRTSLLTGVFFLLTFVSAIVGAALYAPVLTDPDFVLGSEGSASIVWGALCEIVLVITNLGTALVLFPVLRRQSESGALGYVAARLIECGLIILGIVSLLSVLTLREQAAAGADGEALRVTAGALVAIHDWTFLLGPGFVVGLGNGLLLGYLMYRSRLVPRPMALLGLIGGPLMSLSGIGVMFGLHEQSGIWSALATLPEIAWEGSLGLYLTIKGFRVVPVLAAFDAEAHATADARTTQLAVE